MEKFSKGNKSGPVSKPVPDAKEAFSNVADGSMDYLNKIDGMASKDTAKLKRGAYKDNRYA